MFEGGENKEKEIKPSLQEDIAKSKSPGYSNKDFGIDREDVEKYKNLYGKGAKGKQIKNMSKSEKESIPPKEDFVESKNWLASEEDLKSMTDGTLKTFIEFTGGIEPEHLKATFILNNINRLQDLVLNGKISKTDADKLIPKFHEQLRNLTERDKKQKLDSEERLAEPMNEAQRKAREEQDPTKKLSRQEDSLKVLTEYLKRIPTKEERERWVDVEYRQEFWTKFTPSMEPRFYTELKEEEGRLFDTRWQLARAAYYKKATIASPEKMIENQDLIMLGMEHMEKLYNIPGVKDALSWYAQKIVLDKTFWDCKNEIGFEQIREKMREFIKENTKEIREEKDEEEKKRLAKDADAVAWNWMWVSNLVESVDSRYSGSASRGRHDGLPGVLASDDLRAVFHPLEKFENKCTKRQEWGVFGKWGVVQLACLKEKADTDMRGKAGREIEEMKKKINFNHQKDKIKSEWLFKGASNLREFWRYNGIEIEVKEDKPGERVVFVNRKAFTPKCYPTTSMRSFWEEINFEDNQGKKTPLLNFLLSNKEINWREIKSAFWVDYIPIKLNKAVKLLGDYFKGGVKLVEGGETEWADPLKDIFVRLKLDKNKNFHNLKVWSAYAGFGGMLNPDSKFPTLPLRPLDRAVMGERLRRPDVGFLEPGERLKLSY